MLRKIAFKSSVALLNLANFRDANRRYQQFIRYLIQYINTWFSVKNSYLIP